MIRVVSTRAGGLLMLLNIKYDFAMFVVIGPGRHFEATPYEVSFI